MRYSTVAKKPQQSGGDGPVQFAWATSVSIIKLQFPPAAYGTKSAHEFWPALGLQDLDDRTNWSIYQEFTMFIYGKWPWGKEQQGTAPWLVI